MRILGRVASDMRIDFGIWRLKGKRYEQENMPEFYFNITVEYFFSGLPRRGSASRRH